MISRVILRQEARGFTLLEVMVAVAILALVLTGVMNVFTSSLKGIGKTELYTEGVMAARDTMESFLLNPDLTEGTYSGQLDDRFQYSVEVIRRETAVEEEVVQEADANGGYSMGWLDEESPVALYEINTIVSWPDSAMPGSIKLTTMTLRILEEDTDQEDSQQ